MLDITRNAWHYTFMEIENIRDKALRALAEEGSARGLPEPKRLAKMLAFIAAAEVFDDLSPPPNFGFHALKGDRSGTYAMTVTRNWRLTFTKADETTIADLDLEDYH